MARPGGPARGPRLPGELPRGGHAHFRAQLLAPWLADRGAILKLPEARLRGLPARPAGVQGRRYLRGSRDRGTRPLRAHNRRLGASRLRVQGPRRGRQLLGLRRLGRDARARLAVPAYSFPENRQDLVALRVVVRNGYSRDIADMFLDDLKRLLVRLEKQPSPTHDESSTGFSH